MRSDNGPEHWMTKTPLTSASLGLTWMKSKPRPDNRKSGSKLCFQIFSSGVKSEVHN